MSFTEYESVESLPSRVDVQQERRHFPCACSTQVPRTQQAVSQVVSQAPPGPAPCSHPPTLPPTHTPRAQELHEEVLSRLPASARPRVLVGSITHGCYRGRAAPLHVVHAGRGACTFAQVDARLPSLADARHQEQ